MAHISSPLSLKLQRMVSEAQSPRVAVPGQVWVESCRKPRAKPSVVLWDFFGEDKTNNILDIKKWVQKVVVAVYYSLSKKPAVSILYAKLAVS